MERYLGSTPYSDGWDFKTVKQHKHMNPQYIRRYPLYGGGVGGQMVHVIQKGKSEVNIWEFQQAEIERR